MATAQVNSTFSIAGKTILANTSKMASGEFSQDLSGDDILPAGNAGTLTTRTDANTGVATVAEGHGVTDSDTVDVYWAAGVRYSMDVTATDATTISVDLGDGDDLPDQDTVIIVTKQVEIDCDFDGDDLKMIVAVANLRAHVDFQENDDTSLYAKELIANGAWYWISDMGDANPLTGDPVGKIMVSAGTAVATEMQIAGLYDNVD